MRTLVKIIAKTIASILLLIFAFIAANYAFFPVYDFEESTPFTGNKIYNPYQGNDTTPWLRSNFHAHSQRWGGTTNGATDIDTVIARYKEFGYAYIGISNYQDKSKELESLKNYLPIYERGWGYAKFHLLVMGNAPIYWSYPPLYSNLSSKQHLINQSIEGNDLVCLNHLAHVRGLDIEDLNYLCGYHLTEIWGGMGDSRKYWDRALSAGHRSFLLANDDSHNANNAAELSRFVTFVQSPDTSYTSLKYALIKGSAYAVAVPNFGDGDRKIKIEQTRQIDRFKGLTLTNDTIQVQFSQKADSILLIGQGGTRRYLATDTTLLIAQFAPTDTYLRAEAYFPDGVRIALNPLYRYPNDPITLTNTATPNTLLTVLSTLGYCIVTLLLILLGVKMWLPKQRKRQHPRYYSLDRNNERLKK